MYETKDQKSKKEWHQANKPFKNMVCPCSVLFPDDPKFLSEDTNKMSK
jgi:hypothetical protein